MGQLWSQRQENRGRGNFSQKISACSGFNFISQKILQQDTLNSQLNK